MSRVSVIFSTFALFLILVKPVFSQDITGRWAVGYRYSYVNADDDDFRKAASANGINLTYGLNENLAIELEADHFDLKSKAHTRLGVTEFHTNLQLRKSFNNFVPYLIGGVGLQYYNYSELGLGDRRDDNVSISYKTGIGLEYFINKNLALNTEGAYVYGDTGSGATLDVYSWRVSAGLKYYF